MALEVIVTEIDLAFYILGMTTIFERTCEDPMALEEIVTEIDLADLILVNEGVALCAQTSKT